MMIVNKVDLTKEDIKMTKIRYEAIWWSDKFGTVDSMRFDNQKEAFELAKECAKTTLTFLRKLTWENSGIVKTEQVRINKDGTWK